MTNLQSVTLRGGKTLQATFAKLVELEIQDIEVLRGLRFNTRVEGRDFLAFVPTTSITGINGEFTAEPPETWPRVNLSDTSGLFIEGGRFIPIAEPVVSASLGGSVTYATPNRDGGRDIATTALASVIAFVGDLRTADERTDDAVERKARSDAEFIRTYGIDPDTFGKARVKQAKDGRLICANCERPVAQGHLPVFIRSVGIVHRDARCNPFTRDGLVRWNARG